MSRGGGWVGSSAVHDFHGYYTITNVFTLSHNSGTFVGVCCKLNEKNNIEKKKKKQTKEIETLPCLMFSNLIST